MSFDKRYFTLEEAANYMNVTIRWMRRNWPNLLRNGVEVYRVPKDSPKGRLMFRRESLEKYMQLCQLTADRENIS